MIAVYFTSLTGGGATEFQKQGTADDIPRGVLQLV
jgi:hypothetical protein